MSGLTCASSRQVTPPASLFGFYPFPNVKKRLLLLGGFGYILNLYIMQIAWDLNIYIESWLGGVAIQ